MTKEELCGTCVNRKHCARDPLYAGNVMIGCGRYRNGKKVLEETFGKVKAFTKALTIAITIGVLVFGGFSFYYFWTKSALTEMTGKEPSFTTVIWAMNKRK